MSYFKKAVSGLYWTGSLRLSLRAFSIVRTIILARLLTPAQLGVYGVAALTMALLETLTETGINVFLIQETDSDKYLNTAWIVSILRGIVISLIIILSAGLVSSFFHSPASLVPIYLISLVAFIRGFINPAEVVFQKQLKFNLEFRFRSVLFLTEAVVTIIAAFLTRSATSMIWGLMASALAEVIISFVFIHPTPKLNYLPDQLKQILHRGKWVTAAGIFNYLYQNLDNIVVGRLLGVAPLGLYDTSYKISSVPITEFSDVISKVTFPIYAQIRTDRSRLLKAYLKSTLVLSALVIPFGLTLFLFPQLIVLLLGSKWLPAVPALRFLSVYGVIRSISGSSSALFLALNKTHYVTLVTLASILGLGLTIIPLVQNWGLVGAAFSAILGSLASVPVVIYFLFKLFPQNYASR